MRTRELLLIVSLVALAVMGPALYTHVQAPGQPPATNKPAAIALVGPSGWVPKSVTCIKASNTGKYNGFGYFLALSGDGNTLAASAPKDNSGAKGVNGNQADQSVLDSGAVCVYY
jgi:hypothetical protein